jgi:hypothetical protein
MKGKILGLMVLVFLMLLPVAICCGVAFADNGGSGDSDYISQIWVIVVPFLTLAAVFYWSALRQKIALIWAHATDNFWWKVRCSLLACFTSVWPAAKTAFKDFPIGTLLNLLIRIVKARLGIPAAYKQVGKIFKT